MAQSYAPLQPQAQTPVAAPSALVPEAEEPTDQPISMQDIQEAYVQQKDDLVNAIDSTKTILSDLSEFNKNSWILRYPHLQPTTQPQTNRRSVQRSMTFADDPSSTTEVVFSSRRAGMQRSMSLASIPEGKDEDTPADSPLSPPTDFNVIRLDLKLGNTRTASPATLVSQLEKSSIANLLDDRIAASIQHIEKLRTRIEDTSSKVLVTGDLNAGKSTFVNSLLRRPVMPVDQQPCTTMFCEVHDATENGGKEEIHLVKDGVAHNVTDPDTYIRADIADLETITSESEHAQQVLKLYISDARNPEESLIHNGVVDISLIDAPGLNRDSLKTTAVFARQEEIDVVVFVVSAENHFTLSAKEFLWTASNEKAYLFIVVNKYDQIRDKARCRRLVLDQIKQLSPRTWDDADDLVHFVDSSAAPSEDFGKLESALRTFVLVKRSKSKLAPASTYLSNLLSDIDLLAGANSIVAQAELDRAKADLEHARPILETMKAGRETFEDGLENIEEEGAREAAARTTDVLRRALDKVANGELAVASSPLVSMPSYPGLLRLWDYARDVRRALLKSLDLAVRVAEDEARLTTVRGVTKVSQLADAHLPAGVERSKRVFMPEAMFAPRNRKGDKGKNVVVAGGTHGVGLAQRADLLEVSVADIVDLQHYVTLHLSRHGKSSEIMSLDPVSTQPALSLMSLSLGALTMVSSKTLGARAIFEAIARVSDLFGNKMARRWLGVVALGFTIYFVMELPNTIPRTVGRRVKRSLMIEAATADLSDASKNGNGSNNEPKTSSDGAEETVFTRAQAARIARETRKVLRLASWDVRERFRGAMDERGREVKSAEELERKAGHALAWFGEVGTKTADVRVRVGSGLV